MVGKSDLLILMVSQILMAIQELFMFDWVLIDRLPIGSRYNGGQRCGGYLPEQDIVVFFSKQKVTFSSDKNANPTFTASKL